MEAETVETVETVSTDELEKFQAIVQQLSSFQDSIDQLSGDFDVQLHNLNNAITQQSLEIRSLQQALPDPAPIVEEDILNEPPPTATSTANPNQATSQNQPQNSQQAPTTPTQETQGDTIDLQLLGKRLAVIEDDLRSLPPKLERGITSTLYSTLNIKPYILYGVGAALLHCGLTAGLIVVGLQYYPPPLTAHNEGQLFQIYKKIR